jgi:hypothetical protein
MMQRSFEPHSKLQYSESYSRSARRIPTKQQNNVIYKCNVTWYTSSTTTYKRIKYGKKFYKCKNYIYKIEYNGT